VSAPSRPGRAPSCRHGRQAGLANTFYRERINQHFKIGLEAVRMLRDESGPDQLHSRKLRSFDEPAFR
jgi:AMP nucleosidase